ncbi:hypothetical protein L208DRAFT_1321030, partial [Tricholoma matsutake]
DDICCGSEYLKLPMTCFLFSLWMLHDFTATGSQAHGLALLCSLICHAKDMVLPTFMIGGPNAPRQYGSFIFPMFAHLSACQKLGLQIWDV